MDPGLNGVNAHPARAASGRLFWERNQYEPRVSSLERRPYPPLFFLTVSGLGGRAPTSGGIPGVSPGLRIPIILYASCHLGKSLKVFVKTSAHIDSVRE